MGGLIIQEIYGGGGNAGATYSADYVVILNTSAASISLAGYALQYTSAAATGSWQVGALSGTVPAGGFFLVKLASGPNGAELPAPDLTLTIAMATTAGKLALTSSTIALSGAVSAGAAILDMVGYGTTANAFEGASAAPAPSATVSISRDAALGWDTNNNAFDFTADFPNPRNSSSPQIAVDPFTEGNDNVILSIPGQTWFALGGQDYVVGTSGSDTINGDAGNDTLIGGAGNDTLNGGGDFDTADESDSTTWDVGYAFSTGSTIYRGYGAEVDSLTSIELIKFGSGVDTVYSNGTVAVDGGTNSNYLIMNGTGPFTVHLDSAQSSNFNLLYLGAGADTADVLGSTYAYIFGLGGADTITLGTAGGWAYGGDGNDTLSGAGSGNDILIGEAGNDTLNGLAGEDVIYAGIDNDSLSGGDDNDTLWGEAGNDTLTGGNGTLDFLIAQDGADRLVFDAGLDIGYGGSGADVFVWNAYTQGADIVGDFSHAEGDKLNFDHTAFGVAAGLNLVLGVNLFIGAGAVPTQAAPTVYLDTASNLLWFDSNGTGAGGANAITFLSNGGGGLTASDMVFT